MAFKGLCPFLLAVLSEALVVDDSSVFVYFGQGCFWHIQHSFIGVEQTILGRDQSSYTSLAGYAGGTGANVAGHACYPFASTDGRLGHAEAVGMTIPKAKVKDFAAHYYGLFKGINRVDTMDKGRDYRAFIGIPGGMQSKFLQDIQDPRSVDASLKFTLKEGMGGDDDTLGKADVWVYDSLKFPFYQAEVYHQFHDDFMPTGKYPQTYNDMRDALFKQCRIQPTECARDEAFKKADQSCSTQDASLLVMPPGSAQDTVSGGGGSQFLPTRGGSGDQTSAADRLGGSNPMQTASTIVKDPRAADNSSVQVYFGQGCFWHIQHEFITAEKTILGRDESSYTALTGYAGGTGPNSGGHVCYPPRSSDGSLGHAEAIEVVIPKTKVKEFATYYFSLFSGMNRVDTQDVGRDYRAVIGIPGGMQSEYVQLFRDAQGSQKFELKEGIGGDEDTLGKAWVWVYDSLKFPWYQGEAYHQFHDDFMPTGKYPQEYNDLREKLLKQCRLQPTNCPGDEAFKPSAKTCTPLGLGISGCMGWKLHAASLLLAFASLLF